MKTWKVSTTATCGKNSKLREADHGKPLLADIPHIKPLTKSELDIAIDKFCKSGDEYLDPNPQGLSEHIFYATDDYIEVSYPYKCEKCKRICFDSRWVLRENIYEPSGYQKFQTIAERYRYAGYDAHVYFYCDDCFDGNEYPGRVAFSFRTEGMTEPIICHEIFAGFTKQYELALIFLLGKQTVCELAEEDVNSVSGDPWDAKAYISAITKILKTGIDSDPVVREAEELLRQAKTLRENN